jgi:hypothetical protein
MKDELVALRVSLRGRPPCDGAIENDAAQLGRL